MSRSFVLGLAAWFLGAAYADAAPVRVACVGDSITYGAGLADPSKTSYPADLGARLGAGYDVRNFGVSGATLLRRGEKPWWSSDAYRAAADFAPGVVVIMLGTNDSKPQNWVHRADFERDYEALIAHFAALPSHPRIYAVLPVPAYGSSWGVDEAVISGAIIPAVRAAAAAQGARLIDMHTALSGHPEMFPDTIHPNEAGARLIASAVAAALAVP